MDIIKKQIKFNRTKRTQAPAYIVIHDTGNKGAGADALAHFNYFNGGDRQSSADFFVDDKSIIQVNDYNKFYTWHCGDGNGKYGITNKNSLGIEICVNSDGNYDMAVKNTIELVKKLMRELNIPIGNVVRHYDASKKSCPASMSANNWLRWWQFKNSLNYEEIFMAEDIVKMLSKIIEINDIGKAVKEVEKAKKENSSLYWILYKIVNKKE
jgi:N-acetylmuramoyl-L-alanine amidase